jgi:hypothetical protein
MKNFKSQMGDAELREHYEKMDGVAKKYASEIKEEIEEHLPRDFWTEEDIESSIESILDGMYEEIKQNIMDENKKNEH